MIKIATNSPIYRAMTDNMDVNAGAIADGEKTVQQVGQEIFDLLLEVASGTPHLRRAPGAQGIRSVADRPRDVME